MRTLVLMFVLSTAALAQNETLMASSATPATPEFSSSLAVSAAPMIKAAPPVQPELKPEQREANRRSWYVLAAASHGASALDAWTTNRALRAGSVELNPVLKPFAGSAGLYPVMQMGPSVADFIGLRMRRSNRPLVRKLWWVPQVASTAASLSCAASNVRNF